MKNALKTMIVLCALSPLAAQAGWIWTGFSCSKNPDGSGTCLGTRQTARASSDTTASMEFIESSGGSQYFQARQSGVYYTCYVNSSLYPAVASMFTRAYLTGGYSYITWDASGYCNYLLIENGSAFQNY